MNVYLYIASFIQTLCHDMVISIDPTISFYIRLFMRAITHVHLMELES